MLDESSGDSWLPGSSSFGILHTAAHVRTLLSEAKQEKVMSTERGTWPQSTQHSMSTQAQRRGTFALQNAYNRGQQRASTARGTDPGRASRTATASRQQPPNPCLLVAKPSSCFRRKFNFPQNHFHPSFLNCSSKQGAK